MLNQVGNSQQATLTQESMVAFNWAEWICDRFGGDSFIAQQLKAKGELELSIDGAMKLELVGLPSDPSCLKQWYQFSRGDKGDGAPALSQWYLKEALREQDEVSLLVISDIHHGKRPAYSLGHTYKLTHQALRLSRGFTAAANFYHIPSACIQLGDLVEESGESAKKHLNLLKGSLEGFKHLAPPILHVIGNHDVANFDFPALSPLLNLPLPYYFQDIGTTRVVTLFSSAAGGYPAHPRIDDSQMIWLERVLGEAEGAVLIFSHHPLHLPDLQFSRWFATTKEQCVVSNAEQVLEILKGSGKVKGVFNGHVHHFSVDVLGGIPFFSLPSATENVAGDGVPAGAYSLIEISKNQLRVTVNGRERAVVSVFHDEQQNAEVIVSGHCQLFE